MIAMLSCNCASPAYTLYTLNLMNTRKLTQFIKSTTAIRNSATACSPWAFTPFTKAVVILFLFILFFLADGPLYASRESNLLYGYYMVQGKSMDPVFGDTTAVLVKPIPFANIEPGDVIVFDYKGKLIAHRAIRKLNGRWLTQGDNMSKRDSIRVSISNYRGWVYIDSNTKFGDDVIGNENSDDENSDDENSDDENSDDENGDDGYPGDKPPLLSPEKPLPLRQIYLYVDGTQYGPYSEALLRERIAGNKVSSEWMAWHDGLNKWAPLKKILE